MTKHKLLIGLIVLVLASAALAGWWFLLRSGGDVLANPRALVPATSEVYAEIPSISAARAALRELGGLAGMPLGIESATKGLPRVFQDALANPVGYGLDESRPLGLAARISGEKPLAVGFLPVIDAAALAQALSVERTALEGDEPVKLEGAVVLIRRGYLLASSEPEAIKDLLTLDSAPLGIPEPPAGTLVSTYFSPAAIEAARKAGELLSSNLPSSARLGASFLTSALESVEGLQVNLTGAPDAFGIRFLVDMKEGSGLAEAFKDAAGAPSLVRHLPNARVAAGARVNPEGMRRAAKKMLETLEPLVDDTEVIAVMRASLDVISNEMAVAFLNWDPTKPADVRSVSLQTIPSENADQFITKLAELRDHGVRSMSRLMRGAGLENVSQTADPLDAITQDGIELTGTAITTHLDIQPPPGADSATIATFERMSTQRVVQRFGRVKSNGQDLYLTVTGADTALAGLAIGAAITPRDPSASWKQALQKIGDRVVGWVLIDPSIFKPRHEAEGTEADRNSFTPTGPPATIVIRFQDRRLDVDLSLPKEAIKQMVQ